MQNEELIKEFIEEAGIHLDNAEVNLLKLEEKNGDADTIHNIFRAVHSIKGTAGFFSLQNIVNLAHAMENLFGEIRNGNLMINNEIIDAMLAGNDALRNMVADIANSDRADISGLLQRINDFISDRSASLDAAYSKPRQADAGREIEEDSGSILRGALEKGMGIFLITLDVSQKNISASQKVLLEIKENMATVGQIIASDFNEAMAGKISVPEFLVTSVLDRDLLSMALELSTDAIEKLDLYTGLDKMKHLTRKAAAVKTDKRETSGKETHAAENVSPGKNSGETAMQKNPAAPAANNDLTVDTVRVNVSLLNDLLNLASEMVLGRNRLLRIVETYRKEIPGLNAVLQNIDGITTDLQEKIMQTRMQPISKIFHKFPRIIRELSRNLEKDIELLIEGNEVELDKSIIEALADPLTHLVRNALDHGIESPGQREKAGKSRTGTINLRAYHEGGHVVIDIIDNGAGIDIEKVKNKALEKGLIQQEEAFAMRESEVLALLYRPGFSTAEKVTDLSGRGVGLDVVKNNIEKLGGVLEIMTKIGRGTTFRLTLPLTLAIVPSLLVEVEGQKFALPQVNLQEMVRIKPGDNSRRIEKIRDSLVLRLRGNLLPTVHLADVLGLKRTKDSRQLTRVLVIKSGSKRFGLIVDSIDDDEEILVKNLPRALADCQCYSGMTILGDGKIAMILDPEGIAVKSGLRFAEESREDSESRKVPGEYASIGSYLGEEQSLLLFKCSGPEIFCINLAMVARVEKIDASQIETIGSKEYIQFRGDALRVIRPEKYLPVTKSAISRQKLFVIIPKLVKYPLGILIENILDTTSASLQFSHDDIKAKGLVGSAIIEDRITLVLNIYELFEMACPEYYQVDYKSSAAEKGRTILVAEDTPFFAKMEKNYLEWAGYKVISAGSGAEAWKKLQQTDVDAVISDIVMPEMDGYELVKRIRADSRLAGLPVIALSSKSDTESVQKGIDAGFDRYEIKLDKERLLESLKAVLQIRHTDS